jgi:FtsP/CotA-like multicopper oxidase with cupredoxin domain
MPVPAVKEALSVGAAPFEVGAVTHGVAPEWWDRRVAERPDLTWFEDKPTRFYQMEIKSAWTEIVPGKRTQIFGYDGLYPGPTFRMRVGEPALVRQYNRLSGVELSTHLHGGHNPAHSDGYPNFYLLPGEGRDYFWTNTVPMLHGRPDFSESPSTMWYHDHGMDITAYTVLMGLAGFAICTDALEDALIADRVLPATAHDIPVAIQDRTFNSDGSIFFDPLDHDGYLGDVYVVNGKAFPVFRVQRRKYRFRFLNGCNARVLELRRSDGGVFIGLGKDTWLFPQALEQRTLLLAMANRADVVIDFSNAADVVYLENILEQDDGRGPDGDLDDRKVNIPGTRILKFIVEGARVQGDVSVTVGTPLRPHEPIPTSEVVRTRTFEFGRSRGAWVINGDFFDEGVANAVPVLGSTERWIFRNNSGGWWHPVHIHLESHQQVRLNEGLPPMENRFKSDVAVLGGNTEIELLMRFRTFPGPFVFHCHNLEHEDMRMMFVFDPRTAAAAEPSPIQASYP